MGLLNATTKAAIEGFLDVGNADKRRETYTLFVAEVLATILALIILAFIGQYLWNNAIIDLFSFAKPAHTWFCLLW